MKRLLVSLLAVATAGVAATAVLAPTAGLGATEAAAPIPPIHHVFIIVLENESASATFGPNPPAPYLATTLRAEGAYLPHYYGTGHESNDNYIAMISGQAPNPQNQGDCQIFDNFEPGTIGAYGQATGTGCVFPTSVQTISDQLDAAGLTWRDYNQSMGADPSRESSVCAHPALGQRDGTQTASATDEYATRHNPFVYFHSIIDNTSECDTHVVNLNDLPQDLQSASSTPNYVFITPDLCGDGHDASCADKSRPGGFAGINQFLEQWVPMITGSPAYKQDNGLLAIIFDEASTSDTSSCCGEIAGPNSPSPGVNGPGGGDTGAVLLSPCIKPLTVTMQSYNHYSLLRSVEDIFGLPHLGYAQLPGETSFGSDIFNASCKPLEPIGKVRIEGPTLASDVSTSPRFKVSWSANDPVAAFTVQVEKTSAPTSGWRTLVSNTTSQSLTFVGKLGATYEFQVTSTASDKDATAVTVVPSGTHVRGGSYHGHWRLIRVRRAWRQHAKVGSSGASFTLSYTGGTVYLIADVGPRGGKARVTLDGRSYTISLHSSALHTREVIFSRRRPSGHHHLRLVVLRGRVALEGVAIADRAS